MPDRRAHRGPHPEDARLFAAEVHAALRQATGDLCWLMSRGYARESSLKLVGNRHGLQARQRIAVARCACSDEAAADRQSREVTSASPGRKPGDSPYIADASREPSPGLRPGLALHRGLASLAGRALWIDGYNVLTTIEAALGGGVLLFACDGTYRDMASMHGSYRKVAETLPALELLGRMIADLGVTESIWYLDRPVSNSGRLKGIMEGLAAERGWAWRVELVDDPDAVLTTAVGTAVELPRQHRDVIVATADSAILDCCDAWLNLARETVERHVPGANLVDLRNTAEPDTPPLSDDDLVAAAEQIFLELDRREARDAH